MIIYRFWIKQSHIEGMLSSRARLNRKISLRDFQIQNGGDEASWIKGSEAQRLFQEIKACELNQDICKRQSERLDNPENEPKKTMRSVFVKLFMTSPLGLGLGKEAGVKQREAGVQSKFRAELIE